MNHEPLPYIVRLCLSKKEDDIPVVEEKKVVAYSVMEAATQAMLEFTGHVEDKDKVRIEYIGPDIPAYWNMMAEQLARAKK